MFRAVSLSYKRNTEGGNETFAKKKKEKIK